MERQNIRHEIALLGDNIGERSVGSLKKKQTEYKGEKTELREERRRAFSKEDIKGTERGASERDREQWKEREKEREHIRARKRGGHERARERGGERDQEKEGGEGGRGSK